MKFFKATLLLAALGCMNVAIAQPKANHAKMESHSDVKSDQTIVGVAASNDAFSTLVTAVKAADLVETLNSEGPFTVFAPTNDAFDKLPEGTVASLLKNKPALTKILTYHVVSGEFKAADVIKAIKANDNAFKVETVAGEWLTLSLKNGSVVLTDVAGNTSMVTATDVDASNGVIHVIDTVVMPKM